MPFFLLRKKEVTCLKILKREQYVKKYFDNKSKLNTFASNEKVLLWDSAHANRGKHSKSQIFGSFLT